MVVASTRPAAVASSPASVARDWSPVKRTHEPLAVVFESGYRSRVRMDNRIADEESLRLPLLVRYPPLTMAGTVVKEMVLSLDLAQTLLDVCGVKPLPNADGRSWKPLLEGKTEGWWSAFFHQYNYEAQFPYTPNVRAVRTTEWKYIRDPHGDGKPDRHASEQYDL